MRSETHSALLSLPVLLSNLYLIQVANFLIDGVRSFVLKKVSELLSNLDLLSNLAILHSTVLDCSRNITTFSNLSFTKLSSIDPKYTSALWLALDYFLAYHGDERRCHSFRHNPSTSTGDDSLLQLRRTYRWHNCSRSTML